ncbi:streptophobe family protein [Streptomyces sp. ET3-23]|uniref:streptophobe family protein n=1 Tax=Streptomyces sp. ET3-23 TaxID=2885643 RepID=UPI001D129332|nr:streptophobe family protein [Streptomyces sp. ET3-23]MCC2275853.1 streptophobe family protein [Streptomyces sp. ET3-23]
MSRPLRAWGEALAAVVAGTAAMAAVAAAGLWAAGADGLPGDAFPSVVAATMVAAVGGSVELTGGAGFFGHTAAELTVVPLSVTLAWALATGTVFLHPLRHRAVTGGTELLGRVARTAVLWLLVLLLLTRAARHTFTLRIGGDILNDIGEALGVTPAVGFRADPGPTLGFGLLWLLAVLAAALAVSRRAPLPPRLLPLQDAVRPAAFAMLAVLLAYVVLGVVVGVVTLFTHGHPAQTCAVLLLGLPNLAWMAFGVGLGGSWTGHVPAGIGLPMPSALAAVLREPHRGEATVNATTLAEHDGRAWVLVALAALALLAAGFLAAVRAPARTRTWQHAVHLAVALAMTLLATGLLTNVSARYGLSLLGLGDLGGFGSGEVRLHARLLHLVGLGVLWGLAAGVLGSLLAVRVRRRGEVEEEVEGEGTGP